MSYTSKCLFEIVKIEIEMFILNIDVYIVLIFCVGGFKLDLSPKYSPLRTQCGLFITL